jgi:hypothetical protein
VELSWLMKLRIAAVFATGVVLIGIFAWPLVAPPEPFGAVSLVSSTISFTDTVVLMTLAFITGLVAYFLAWPFGRQIGILAVPAGLAVWAVRSGSMASLMQLNATVAQRQAIFAVLRWEVFFWLAVVAAGFLGVLTGWKIHSKPEPDAAEHGSKPNIYLNSALALAASTLVARFSIMFLAQDIRFLDGKSGSVVAQPAIGQLVFAVSVSFGLAAFIVKKLLNAGCIWPIIASVIVTAFSVSTYGRENILQYLTQHWPGVFFSNAVMAILPVQMVAFGTLGSVAGYWLAVRYNYWRQCES